MCKVSKTRVLLLVLIGGFSGDSDGKKFACNAGDQGLIPGLGRFPCRQEWLPTLVFLENSMDRGRLQSTGCKEADTTE